MKSKNNLTSLFAAYVISVLFIAIFLAQFPFWVILGVSAVFIFLVYLLYVALRKMRAMNSRKLTPDERLSRSLAGLLVSGVLLVGAGGAILFQTTKFRVEDIYDFSMRGIIVFLAMTCLGFGLHILLQIFNQREQ